MKHFEGGFTYLPKYNSSMETHIKEKENIKLKLNSLYGRASQGNTNPKIADEKVFNQNTTIETAMQVIESMYTQFNFKDISFYNNNGELRFRIEI